MKNSSLASALVLALLASCATLPSGAPAPTTGAADLAGWALNDHAIQVRIDVPSVGISAELARNHPTWAPLLARVQTLWIGLPDPGLVGMSRAASLVRVAAEGKFGAAETAWALFWNHPPVPWTVVQPREGFLLVERGPIDQRDSASLAAPEDWGHDSVRLVWDHPGASLLGTLASRVVDLRRLVLELEAGDTTLTGSLSLELADARSATAAVVLLKLFGGELESSWNQNLSWRVEGNKVVGEPVIFTQRSMINLITTFSTSEAP